MNIIWSHIPKIFSWEEVGVNDCNDSSCRLFLHLAESLTRELQHESLISLTDSCILAEQYGGEVLIFSYLL